MAIKQYLQALNRWLHKSCFSLAVVAAAHFTMGTGNNDILSEMGYPRDMVYGNGGNDIMVYTPSLNTSNTNYYDGGPGIDVLWLRLTDAELQDVTMQADLISYYYFVINNNDVNRGNDQGPVFKFRNFNLTIRNFENVVVEKMNTRDLAPKPLPPATQFTIKDSSIDSSL